MKDRDNFFWLVGLMEGEGSFLRPSPSKPRESKVDIEMSDLDAIRRVAALFGVTYRVRNRQLERPNTSVTYSVRLAGKRAARLMWRLRPYMSARRQGQIDRALVCYVERGDGWDPALLPSYQFEPVCNIPLCPNHPVAENVACEEHCRKSD